MGLELYPTDETLNQDDVGGPLNFSKQFQNYLDATKDQEAARTSSLMLANPTTPDEMAEGISIGSELGVPPTAVALNPQIYKDQLEQKKATTALSNAPLTTKWLNDVANAQLAKDDLPNLTSFEGFGRMVGQSYIDMGDDLEGTQAGLGVRTGATTAKVLARGAAVLPYQAHLLREERLLGYYGAIDAMPEGLARFEVASQLGLDPMSTEASFANAYYIGDEGRRQKFITAAIGNVMNDKEAIGRAVGALEEYRSEMMETQGRVPNFTDIEDARGFADWFAFNSGQAIPLLAVTALAGALGGVPGVAGSGYAMGAGDINAEMLEQGIIDQPGAALVGAVPYAGLEFLGPAARPFRGVSGQVLEEVSQSFFRRLGREVGENVVEEFINEMGQEIVKDITVDAAGGEELVLNDETLLRWLNAGMAGAAGGVVASPITTAMQSQTVRDLDRAEGSGGTAAMLEEVDQMAAESKVKERSPEKFEEALESQGLDQGVVYVPADGLNELFQSQNLTPDAETLEVFGIDPETFSEKVAAGVDVAIPLSAYASQISGTDAAQWIKDNATMSPEELSRADAAKVQEGLADRLEAEFEEASQKAEANQDAETGAQIVYDDIYSQLREAGRSPTEAQYGATLWSGFFGSGADRTGSEAAQLRDRFGVEIRREGSLPPAAAEPGAQETPQGETAPAATLTLLQTDEATRAMEVEVELDDGSTGTAPAGEVHDIIQRRMEAARQLLDCLNG